MRAALNGLSGVHVFQSFAALADQAVVSGTRFAVTILIGRIAGLEELGLYAIGFSIVILMVTVQESLLMSPYAVLGRRESAAGQRRFAGSTLVLSLVLSTISAGILATAAVVAPAIGYAGKFGFLSTLALVVGFVLLQNFARKMCFAHFQVGTALLLDAGVSALQIAGLAVLAVTASLTATSALAIMGLASAVPGMIWLVVKWRFFSIDWRDVSPQLAKNWSFGKWILGTQQIAVLGGSLILWILTALSGVAAAGLFAACSIVVTAANPLLLGLSNILEPRTAKAWADGHLSELLGIVHRTTLAVTGTLALYWLVVFLAGDTALAWLFDKPQFFGQGHLLAVLAFVVLLRGFTLAQNLGLRALGVPRKNFAASLFNLAVTLASAYPLMLEYGALGGGYCMLFGVIAGTCARLWFFIRTTRSL
ncbi:lipopolysaccharide biosynthesis protein [Labrenzia sp. PHM005]|uniref:lipopolysaccharide biosynthesis protein n=1 Tax=Labrenzia sp. PHM005 TaxID=2590016 RepID=UPI0011402C0D|nr:hypothetical protein [Labrenzia sp. PHM005]QDG76361.1 hypothetical protein FJ695_11015 [Labrenzia sp. PHM005]